MSPLSPGSISQTPIRQWRRGERERTLYIHNIGHWARGDLEFFHLSSKNMLVSIILKSKKYPVFIISILTLFFDVEDDEKTKCGLTFGGSCQIRNRSDQSFVLDLVTWAEDGNWLRVYDSWPSTTFLWGPASRVDKGTVFFTWVWENMKGPALEAHVAAVSAHCT